MIGRIERKFRQLVQDPVLRRWLVRRVLGKEKPEAGEAGPPPYLTGRLPLAAEIPSLAIPVRPATAATALQIGFHGKTVEIDPRCPVAPFADVYEDIETSLAMHRFAWLPFMPAEDAANALTILWPAWRAAHGTPDSSWAWHPYTAAERAINILEFIRTAGWPVGAGGVLDIVSQHAPAIAARLEYFGERGTFNHLANNGLGLHAIGCALAMPGTRAMGFTILAREAERILTPAGVLREGSTHYHFLFTRKYLVAWLAAARAGQADEAGVLLAIAARMVAAAKALALPGGMPLIGDISPDSPPSHLMGLEAGICPWIKRLPEQERQAVAELVGRTASVNSDALLSSGWIRKDSGRFAALASCPPSGWPFMPGHAHQDLGSAEIHFQGKPIFVDPGRGQYGDAGEAALYRSSAAHGTLRIDDQDPYPQNKPYYSENFRGEMAGPAQAEILDDGFAIRHGGYRRLGVGDVARRYRFQGNSMQVLDQAAGRGTHRVERSLVTPLAVEIDADAALLDRRVRVSVDGVRPTLEPITIWHAYGEGRPGTRIVFRTESPLPWSGSIDVTVTA